METGKIVANLWDKKGMSQTSLTDKSGISRVMIGKSERAEAVSSIDAAKKMADALNVSLDYLTVDTKTARLRQKNATAPSKTLSNKRNQQGKPCLTLWTLTFVMQTPAELMHLNFQSTCYASYGSYKP